MDKKYLERLEAERFTAIRHYRMVAEHYARKKRMSEVYGNLDACVREARDYERKHPSLETRTRRANKKLAVKREVEGKVVGKVLTPDEQLAIAMRSLERNEK